MNKITSVNGILLTAQNDFCGHVKNDTAHVTKEERAAWNAKAETSEVNAKVGKETFETIRETPLYMLLRKNADVGIPLPHWMRVAIWHSPQG